VTTDRDALLGTIVSEDRAASVLSFNLEDRGSMFIRNVATLQKTMNYTFAAVKTSNIVE